ncbi:MAG TPA: GGDEF domain-containing protein [Hansschlegelia sp.]
MPISTARFQGFAKIDLKGPKSTRVRIAPNHPVITLGIYLVGFAAERSISMYFRDETDDVKEVLVAQLASSIVPMTIMGGTFIVIGAFVSISLAMPILTAVTVVGGLIAVAKIVLMLMHSKRNQLGKESRSATALWERAHAVTTICFAATVGAVSATTFAAPDLTLQMLATALLFGYCSGIVCRLSIRPFIALPTMAIAAAPVIVSAALYGDASHWMIATIFFVFLVGSAETVRYIHSTALREIGMRLDMATLARNDPLTGLSNRLGLRETFREVAGAISINSMVAIHYLDLDGFKPVNDRHGHAIGDEVLRLVASRLKAALREGDLAARIGGDEFVVLQAPVDNPKEAESYAEKLSDLIIEPYRVGDETIEIGVSVGYAVSKPVIRGLDHLLHDADAALYSMKRAGGGAAGAKLTSRALRRTSG